MEEAHFWLVHNDMYVLEKYFLGDEETQSAKLKRGNAFPHSPLLLASILHRSQLKYGSYSYL